MRINGHAALVRGCLLFDRSRAISRNSAETLGSFLDARSPSVRQYAEQCANMRGLVRKICGRIDRQSAGSLPPVYSPADEV